MMRQGFNSSGYCRKI